MSKKHKSNLNETIDEKVDEATSAAAPVEGAEGADVPAEDTAETDAPAEDTANTDAPAEDAASTDAQPDEQEHVPNDVEATEEEVSLEDVEVSSEIPFTDIEELAYKLLKYASQLKGVIIPRDAFLKAELSKQCEQEIVDDALETTPHAAGVPLEVIDSIADDAIAFESGKVAGISALVGVPGGLLALTTIPADIMQFAAHMLRMGQELAYLYGWPSFTGDANEMDDDDLYGLILLLGAAMQVEGSAMTLVQIAESVSEAGTKESLRQLLGEDEWYAPIKKVLAAMGTTATKGTVIELVSRVIPILSGLIAGGVTYAAFRAGATALKGILRALPQATGEVLPEDQMEELIRQIGADEKADLGESMRDVMETAGERAGSLFSQAEEATNDFTDRATEAAVAVAEQAGAAANVVVDKTAEYATAARDKAVEAAKATAVGFIRGLGNAKKGKHKKEEPVVEPTASEPAAAPTPASDIAVELRILKGLVDEGLITQEEFDAKKRQLLGL